MVSITLPPPSNKTSFEDWNIFFDVDGTLTSTNLFDRLAKKFDFMDEHEVLRNRAIAGEFANDFGRLFEEYLVFLSKASLKDIHDADLSELAVIRPGLKAFFLALKHLFPGINIHLLSGGFTFHCEQIARHVESDGEKIINNIFSNVLQSDEQGKLSSVCIVDDKAEFISQFYKDNVSDFMTFDEFKAKSLMIGDGFNDVSAMKLLENSIALCPTSSLVEPVASYCVPRSTQPSLVMPLTLSYIIKIIANKTI